MGSAPPMQPRCRRQSQPPPAVPLLLAENGGRAALPVQSPHRLAALPERPLRSRPWRQLFPPVFAVVPPAFAFELAAHPAVARTAADQVSATRPAAALKYWSRPVAADWPEAGCRSTARKLPPIKRPRIPSEIHDCFPCQVCRSLLGSHVFPVDWNVDGFRCNLRISKCLFNGIANRNDRRDS